MGQLLHYSWTRARRTRGTRPWHGGELPLRNRALWNGIKRQPDLLPDPFPTTFPDFHDLERVRGGESHGAGGQEMAGARVPTRRSGLCDVDESTAFSRFYRALALL